MPNEPDQADGGKIAAQKAVRSPQYALGTLAALLFIVALLITCEKRIGSWRMTAEGNELERQVKRNIDPMELQKWATNLLARHAGEFQSQDFYGTNMPAQLKKVEGFGYDIEIYPGNQWEEPHLFLFCHSKGGPFLVVGSPTLVNTNWVHWKPGIYFVKPRL